MSITITNAQFKLKNQQFSIPQFQLNQGDFWVVVGGNGSGKSVFAQILANGIPLDSGTYINDFSQIALLSLERQQQIIEQIFNDRNNDTVSPDDFGLTAKQLILNGTTENALCQHYTDLLQISHLLDRPFMQLSTGESRKVLLAQMLVAQPDLLILDEPFEGLDKQSLINWLELLGKINQQTTLVVIVNRLADIPPQATHIALLANLQLVLQGSKNDIEQQSLFQQLIYAENATDIPLPPPAAPLLKLDDQQPRFELENVTIQYGEQKVLDNLSWTVLPHQHWWIKGENGAGKSTLLSILTGDHPQAYANKVKLFGKQRGSGETIWEIKRNIGYLSSQLHLDYRVNCSVLDVIISGFFDSIGIYQQIPEALKLNAMAWLTRLNLQNLAHKPFRSLSWGQQRLLLIVRAMVKRPPVLILDEPLQGLDALNRTLVKQFIDQLVRNSQTQLLFVSHQESDAPSCITHLFEFVGTRGNYHYEQTALKSVA